MISRSRAALASLLVAGSLLLAYTHAAPAAVGTTVRMDVEDLVDGADLVLEGRVASAVASLAEDGRWIETRYGLAVERTWLGEELGVRDVHLPGGVLADGSGMVVPGMPSLCVGERVVLFLTEPGPTGVRMPVGLAQGKMRIVAAPGGRALAVTDASGATLVETEAHGIDLIHVRDYAAVVAEIEAASARKRARTSARGR